MFLYETLKKYNQLRTTQEVMTMYTLKKAKTLLAAAVTGAVALGIQVPCASAEEYVLRR